MAWELRWPAWTSWGNEAQIRTAPAAAGEIVEAGGESREGGGAAAPAPTPNPEAPLTDADPSPEGPSGTAAPFPALTEAEQKLLDIPPFLRRPLPGGPKAMPAVSGETIPDVAREAWTASGGGRER